VTGDAFAARVARACDWRVAEAALGPFVVGDGAPGEPRLSALRVLKERPGRRCVIRYDFVVEGDRERERRYVGKVRARGAHARVHRLGLALRERGFDERGTRAFVVAEPVAMVESLGLNLVRWAPGATLADEIAADRSSEQTLERVGRGLAELHLEGPVPARRHSKSAELAVLEQDLPRAAERNPEHAVRIERLLVAARHLVARLPEAAPVPIHRDFHPEQLLLAGDAIVLIDLDLYTQGDPCVDVGNFVAHLREQALREKGDVRASAAQEAAFLRGYRSVADGPALEALPVWCFLSFVRHVWIASRIPERTDFVPSILAASEAAWRELRSDPRSASAVQVRASPGSARSRARRGRPGGAGRGA